MHSSYTTYSL